MLRTSRHYFLAQSKHDHRAAHQKGSPSTIGISVSEAMRLAAATDGATKHEHHRQRSHRLSRALSGHDVEREASMKAMQELQRRLGGASPSTPTEDMYPVEDPFQSMEAATAWNAGKVKDTTSFDPPQEKPFVQPERRTSAVDDFQVDVALQEHIASRTAMDAGVGKMVDVLDRLAPFVDTTIHTKLKSASVLLGCCEDAGTLSLLPSEELERTAASLPDRDLFNSVAAMHRLLSTNLRALPCRRLHTSDLQLNEVTPSGSYLRLPACPVHENQLPAVPEDPEYLCLYMVMFCSEETTASAMETIAKMCKVPIDCVHTTQLIDSLQCRSQVISVRFPDPELRENARFLLCELNAAHNTATKSSISVFPFSWQKRPVRYGETRGNYFSLYLHDFSAPSTAIHSSLLSVQKHGFLNYFGPRKFGLSVYGHHHIGLSILQGNYGAALIMMVQNAAAESSDNLSIRSLVDSTPWIRELHTLFVSKEGGDQRLYEDLYIRHFSLTTRAMHRSAARAFAWNLMASARYRSQPLGGFEAQLGDFVLGNVSGRGSLEPLSVTNVPWESSSITSESSSTVGHIVSALTEKEEEGNTTTDVAVALTDDEDVFLVPTTQIVMPIPNFNVQQQQQKGHDDNTNKNRFFFPVLEKLNVLLQVSSSQHKKSLQRGKRVDAFGLPLTSGMTEWRRLHVKPRNMDFIIFPEDAIGTNNNSNNTITMSTDRQLAIYHNNINDSPTTRVHLRNMFATHSAPLAEQRLPSKYVRHAKERSTRRGSKAKSGSRGVVMGFVLPPSSYVGSFLREALQVERVVVPTKRHNENENGNELDEGSLRTPGPDVAVTSGGFRHPTIRQNDREKQNPSTKGNVEMNVAGGDILKMKR
eukprot:PhM_4_TR450/c0_g1_i2/m.31159/K06176/truD, PUS7; tRNA pseudouridine13 synthase